MNSGPLGSTVSWFPPLVASQEQVGLLVEALDDALSATEPIRAGCGRRGSVNRPPSPQPVLRGGLDMDGGMRY